jgi:hypothetical protein
MADRDAGNGVPAIALLERIDRRALIAVDLEQTIEVRGPEDLLDHRRHLTEPQLAVGAVDPALEQDQLAEKGARNQTDFEKSTPGESDPRWAPRRSDPQSRTIRSSKS